MPRNCLYMGFTVGTLDQMWTISGDHAVFITGRLDAVGKNVLVFALAFTWVESINTTLCSTSPASKHSASIR